MRDAYPLPTDGERTRDIQLSREDDELWDAIQEEPLPEDNPTRPAIWPHRHDLCGHDCLSGACTGMEAICQACEFTLQDAI